MNSKENEMGDTIVIKQGNITVMPDLNEVFCLKRRPGSGRLIPLSEVKELPITIERSAGHVVGMREKDAVLMY